VLVGEGIGGRRVGFGTSVGSADFVICAISVAVEGMVAGADIVEGETSSSRVGDSVHAVTTRSATTASTATEPRTCLAG